MVQLQYRCRLLLQYTCLVQAAASTVQCQWIELLAGGTGSLSLPLSVRTMETTTTPSPAPSRVWGFMMVVLVTGPLHMKVIEMLSFPELHVLMGVVEKLVTESGSLYWSSCRRALKWRCWHSEDHQLLPNIAGLLIFLLFSMQLQWYPLLWKDAGRTKNKKLNFEKNIDFEFFLSTSQLRRMLVIQVNVILQTGTAHHGWCKEREMIDEQAGSQQ